MTVNRQFIDKTHEYFNFCISTHQIHSRQWDFTPTTTIMITTQSDIVYFNKHNFLYKNKTSF